MTTPKQTAAALAFVAAQTDTATQWDRAVVGMRELDALGRVEVWLEMAKGFKDSEDKGEINFTDIIEHTRLRTVYKSCLGECETRNTSNQMLIHVESLPGKKEQESESNSLTKYIPKAEVNANRISEFEEGIKTIETIITQCKDLALLQVYISNLQNVYHNSLVAIDGLIQSKKNDEDSSDAIQSLVHENLKNGFESIKLTKDTINDINFPLFNERNDNNIRLLRTILEVINFFIPILKNKGLIQTKKPP